VTARVKKTRLTLCCTTSLLSITLSFVLPATSLGHTAKQPPPSELVGARGSSLGQHVTPTFPSVGFRPPEAKNVDALIGMRRDRQMQREEMERWQSLPPEKQLEMRRRMERYKELPPEDRELFRRRHQQWQNLSPQEQERMREELKGWENLSPQEQERIRQKFRRP